MNSDKELTFFNAYFPERSRKCIWTDFKVQNLFWKWFSPPFQRLFNLQIIVIPKQEKQKHFNDLLPSLLPPWGERKNLLSSKLPVSQLAWQRVSEGDRSGCCLQNYIRMVTREPGASSVKFNAFKNHGHKSKKGNPLIVKPQWGRQKRGHVVEFLTTEKLNQHFF